jgi:membrane protein YqaA with SNARE-associated domain
MKDERNIGTVIGMAVLGVVGFLAFSFTIVGGIAGGVLGIMLGRYAGRKISRRI